MIGSWELILIVVVIILLFGAKRIPEIAKGVGRAMFEFKKAKNDLTRESDELMNAAEKNAAAQEKAKKQAQEDGPRPDAG